MKTEMKMPKTMPIKVSASLSAMLPRCACGSVYCAGDTLQYIDGCRDVEEGSWVACPDCGSAIGTFGLRGEVECLAQRMEREVNALRRAHQRGEVILTEGGDFVRLGRIPDHPCQILLPINGPTDFLAMATRRIYD